jgi:superoxide dismutase
VTFAFIKITIFARVPRHQVLEESERATTTIALGRNFADRPAYSRVDGRAAGFGPRHSAMEILHERSVQSRAAALRRGALEPTISSRTIALAIDVWEHAHYLNYRNARPKYLEAVLANLLNWDYAAANLARENETVRAAAQ